MDSVLDLLNDSDTFVISTDTPGYLFRNDVIGFSIYISRHKIVYGELLGNLDDNPHRITIPGWVFRNVLSEWESRFDLGKWERVLEY